MASGGVSLDEHNLKLPQGSRVSVSAWGIHHDEDIYPNAYTFDAFRFSRPHENGTVCEDKKEAHLLVSPSEDYLPFGFGRHACPGRYFAAVETKLFLAYMAVHYDLKQVHNRPGFVSLGHLPTPPIKGKLMIRRKGDMPGPCKGDSAMV
jgi:cytochrome P450